MDAPLPLEATSKAPKAPKVPKVPLGACDYFLLALDDMMGRCGQGQHLGQTILELDALPPVEPLRRSLLGLNAKYPLITARINRNLFTGVPSWVPMASEKRQTPFGNQIPFGMVREKGAAGLLAAGEGEVESLHAFCEQRLNQPIESELGPSNLRVDLVELKSGAAVVMTWSHLLLDGKGAELLLTEWLRLAGTGDLSPCEEAPAVALVSEWLNLAGRLEAAKPCARRFGALSRKKICSLGGSRPTPSKARFRLLTLSKEQTDRVKAEAARLTGALFTMPFFLACSTRVHDTILRGRGIAAPSFIVSLPVQVRRKGTAGPIFQNHLSILFFHLAAEELDSVENSTRAVQNEFLMMMRDRLELSFLRLLEFMGRLPLRWYMAFVKSHFGGELASFFHSHTGLFSPEIHSFFGRRIINAFHIPTVSTPPGTGIFMCEREGRLNITISWRDGALKEEECERMQVQLLEDLQGETLPTPQTVSQGQAASQGAAVSQNQPADPQAA